MRQTAAQLNARPAFTYDGYIGDQLVYHGCGVIKSSINTKQSDLEFSAATKEGGHAYALKHNRHRNAALQQLYNQNNSFKINVTGVYATRTEALAVERAANSKGATINTVGAPGKTRKRPNGIYRLSKGDVKAVEALLQRNVTQCDIAEMLNLSQPCVSRIKNGKHAYK